MRSLVHKRGPVTPEMNITPLIDVVFLLIIFFMLVSQIVSTERLEMLVPQPDDAQTHKLVEENRVVVNVVPRDVGAAGREVQPLLIDGGVGFIQIGQQRVQPGDLGAVTRLIEAIRAKRPGVEVVLRADQALYYEQVQPIMQAIARAGVATIHLAAQMPEAGATAGGQQ